MSRINILSTLFTACLLAASVPSATANPDASPGQPADITPSAYLYRADRAAAQNPPEAWILLMQRANMSLIQPVDVHAPAVQQALCGLLWEEVRRVDHLDLCWPPGAARQPSSEQLDVAYFDGVDDAAHTWWNPRAIRQAAKPEISADGRVYSYKIPVDTWGVVVSVRGANPAAAFAVPELRAFAPDKWKQMDVQIEWGYEEGRARLDYTGRLDTYDGRLSALAPLDGDTGTKMTGAESWRSSATRASRRGLRFHLLYIGSAPCRKTWPYHSQEEDVARTIVTLWTKSGSFSFRAADLENGPILAPEFAFFVRATGPPQESSAPSSAAASARQYLTELAGQHLLTIRQRTALHTEQTWEGAVTAMMRGTNPPSFPQPPFLPAMRIEVPSGQLTAQWNLGAWHLLRHAVKDADGKYHVNDFPFGILASETYMILRSLDLMGMHQEAADGLDQWLKLPLQPHSSAGTHGLSKPDRPLGLFSDGQGALTHAVGPDGVGGHMDAVHAMGPGAIMFALAEHYRLTGDTNWLAANAPRMKANAEWILRQRLMTEHIIPNGERLWNKGLLPAHVVTPDSFSMHMDFYESEAYYWLAVNSMADMLARIDPPAGAKMAQQARAYRKDIQASVDRSITLTPVVATRDGMYHSFIPFAPYVRGFASGAWGWRRCQGHVGALYWDTVQSADPLISPARLLSTSDPRVQGHLDVLEDCLLLENGHLAERSPGFDPDKDWFSCASWQYQCGLERHANIYIQAGDAPDFIRSMLNQYAVDILPGDAYQFREHTTTGPHDKVFEEACFLERLRMMLVQEDGDTLWLARATPRVWLENGKRIAVQNAPTHFGDVGYEIISALNDGRITATVNLPSRHPPREVRLQLRHPDSSPILGVTVDGKKWNNYDPVAGVVTLRGLQGVARVEARYGK
jgi:hypothetical protein